MSSTDEFGRPPRPWPTDSNKKPQSIVKLMVSTMKGSKTR